MLGEDPYPLGLRAMGENVERAIRGSMAQGLPTKPLRLEDIYLPHDAEHVRLAGRMRLAFRRALCRAL